MTCGIPQGSTLGPLLFLLYINDLPNCSKNLIFRIFADDTNLFASAFDLKDLETLINSELEKVKEWYHDKMCFNMFPKRNIHVGSFSNQVYCCYLAYVLTFFNCRVCLYCTVFVNVFSGSKSKEFETVFN